MKITRKMLIVLFTVVFVHLLAACENSTEDSSATTENHSQKNHSSHDTKDNTSNVDRKEEVSNTNNNNSDHTNTDNKNSNEKEETSTNNTADLKAEYLKKLNDTKIEMEKLEAEDTSTYALKKVENDRYDVWDELLNEIYGELKELLTTEEMDQLRIEQRNWITYRDDTAKEASLKFQGGTMEQLEYVAVLANLTEKRCYELVENYMK